MHRLFFRRLACYMASTSPKGSEAVPQNLLFLEVLLRRRVRVRQAIRLCYSCAGLAFARVRGIVQQRRGFSNIYFGFLPHALARGAQAHAYFR